MQLFYEMFPSLCCDILYTITCLTEWWTCPVLGCKLLILLRMLPSCQIMILSSVTNEPVYLWNVPYRCYLSLHIKNIVFVLFAVVWVTKELAMIPFCFIYVIHSILTFWNLGCTQHLFRSFHFIWVMTKDGFKIMLLFASFEHCEVIFLILNCKDI